MLGYTGTLDKSMNGVKTLTDGISIISDGIAQHENIIYNDYIKSQDGQTEIVNDTVTTININAQNITGENITGDDLNTNILNCNYLYVNDLSNPLSDVMEVNGDTKKMVVNGTSDFKNTINVINTNLLQTQTGYIYQTGTNFNTLKDTKINGYLEVGSNITQTGGNTTLKDITCDNITQNSNKGITQTGTSVSNTLAGTTTIKNLTIIDSVTFPSTVTIPGTTTNDDILMLDDSVITQDITTSTTKFNTLRDTKVLNLDIDGNLTQTKSGATATLKNTVIQGTSTLQGDIEQTSGFTKLNTIECNNITLRTNNDINLSGTGKISQSGTGENIMNAITLNNNQNITFNGSGIISQPLNGTNILSHFRGAGFGIIGGRNNTTYSHYQNCQNNNGFQMQYNRDNSTFYSYLLNNRVGSGGGFRFQRYSGGVYVDEPMIIDDNITINKDVSIVGKSISASSATLGIISQAELDCLDNCNINILTKFNTLDSQISSLQTTTGGVTTATTGITYNNTTDTTTIDNNLIVSSGKSLTLGNTNVNSFITDTNTFINASSNTLQGITYTENTDTTTFDNNLTVNKTLLIQGMDVKAEIDALETSFTTGTLNTTNLTAGTVNITNQLNFTNSNYSGRLVNGVGYLKFVDLSTGINGASQIAHAGIETYFINNQPYSHFSFRGKNSAGTETLNRLFIIPNANNMNYNQTTVDDDILVFGAGDGADSQSMNLTVWSGTKTGVRIQPTKTTMTGGDNTVVTDVSGITITGNKVMINNYDYSEETSKVTNIQYANGNYTITTSSIAGNTNVLGVTITVNPRFKKKITFTVPFSLTRSFRVNNDVIQWAQVIESFNVSVNVHKNDVFYSTINNLNSLTNTISLYTNQPSSFLYTYNYYCGSLTFDFTPDYSTTSDVYKFYFNYTNQYTWSTDTMLGFIPAGYEMTTNTTFSGFTTNGDVRTSPILPSFVSFSHNANYIFVTGSSTYTQFNQPIVTPEVNTQTVTSTNINASTVTTNILNVATSIHALNIAGAYLFNGTVNSYNTPIPAICSAKRLEGALLRTINWGVLFPKHKLRFYIFVTDYDNNTTPATSTWVYDVENTSDSPISFTLPSPIYDNTVAWRLYKYINSTWTEITITGLS